MNKYFKLSALFLLCFIISCDSQVSETTKLTSININETGNTTPNTNSNSVNNLETKVETQNEPYDFDNFEFPVCPKIIKETVPKIKSIKLKNGVLEIDKGEFGSIEPILVFSSSNVSYYDLTKDGKKDAIVTIGIKYYQGMERCTFIYSLNEKHPKLLWTYEFGDTYDGGLRNLKIEDGGLLIEQYTKGTARCCPTEYKKMLYVWENDQFVLKSSEAIPVDGTIDNSIEFPSDSNQ